jgi:anaerobic magnesium-protoporphyrin IX monomethyl ester cyclase
MKVILVQPPNLQRSGDWKKMKVSRPPINIALLASYLRKFGHEPVIYDFDWFEGGVNEMCDIILLQKPDVVGFTCLTPRIEITLLMAAKLKERAGSLPIVIGGAHVNAVKERALYAADIDYAIYGEAEDAFVELMRSIETKVDPGGIRNLIYRRNGKVLMNPVRAFISDLDALPFPAWDLLNLQDYKDPGVFNGLHMGVMTTRGCAWNCIFCSSGVVWGRNVRFRSALNVVDELQYIAEKLEITNIMFYDDTFTLNKARFLTICREIVKRRLNLRYYCQLRVDTIDEEIADGLAESGCITAALGIESGDEKILATLKKGYKKPGV